MGWASGAGAGHVGDRGGGVGGWGCMRRSGGAGRELGGRGSGAGGEGGRGGRWQFETAKDAAHWRARARTQREALARFVARARAPTNKGARGRERADLLGPGGAVLLVPRKGPVLARARRHACNHARNHARTHASTRPLSHTRAHAPTHPRTCTRTRTGTPPATSRPPALAVLVAFYYRA